MIGTFGYRSDCSIAHYLPQGKVHDGLPIIVFPQKNEDIVPGRTYEFGLAMTREATYIIDGVTYRVGHAIAPRELGGQEADYVDQVLHRSAGEAQTTTLQDVPGGDGLAALRAKLIHQ